MIAPQTFNNYPEFGVAAVKCCPDAAKYANGYIQGDVLPAEHLNWFLSGATVGVSALQLGMDSLEKEMQNLLCCAGIAPSGSCNTQIYDAVMYQIQASANTKAPNMHASSATTYGVGNADCYGHLKISDTYTSVLSACAGVAASQKGLACVYGVANGKPNLGNTAGCELAYIGSSGTSGAAARSDHVHPIPYCVHTTTDNAPWFVFSRYNACSDSRYLIDISDCCGGTARYGARVAYADCAGKDSSGCSFGTAARCAASAFRASTWTPTCVACTDYPYIGAFCSDGTRNVLMAFSAMGAYGDIGASCACKLTFNPATGLLKATKFQGAIADDGNGQPVTFAYSRAGLSTNPSWIAAWNNYELRAVQPSVLCVGFAGYATCACKDSDGCVFGTAARCAANAFRSCTWRPYDYCTVSSCVSATRDGISGHWTVTAACGSLICDVWKAICWVTGGLLSTDSDTGVVGCYRTSKFVSQNISRVYRNTNFNYYLITSCGSTETSIAICCSCTSAICGLALGGINIL